MPVYQSEIDNYLKAMSESQKNNAASTSDLTPISQLQSNNQQQNKQQSRGFFDNLGHIVSTGAKDVGKAVVAVARPVVDVGAAIGQEVQNKPVTDAGKFVHDSAQLGSDVSGGAVNQFARAVAAVPTAIGREIQDKPITDIQQNAFGTTNQGQIFKKIVGSTVGTAALVAGGATAGGEAAAEAGGAKGLSGAERVMAALKASGKTGVAGATQNAASTEVNNPNASPKQLAESGAVGFGGGAALSGLGSLAGVAINKIFNRGAPAALDELKSKVAAEPEGEQKLLPAGNIQNESTSTVPAKPGTPSTPSTVPVTDTEYTQRFNALSKSFDQQTKAAQNLPPLAQKIALDHVHDTHVQAINQLNDEYLHGKPNPDYQPAKSGTPAQTVPSGFTIQTPADQARVQIQRGQQAQLHQRIGQINSIVKDAQQNGSSRTPDELRALMRERQQAQDVLDGKASYNDVYGNKSQPGPVNNLPFDKDASAPPRVSTASSGNPVVDAIKNNGKAFLGFLPRVAKGDNKQSILNRDFVVGKYQSLIKPVQDLVAGKGAGGKAMDAHDIALIDKIEGNHTDPVAAAAHLDSVIKQAHNPDQFEKVINAMREGYNTRLANDAALGRDVGVRNNYLQHFFDRSDDQTAAKLDDLQQKAQIINKDKPGYANVRTIENYDKADELGLKRLNANSLEDYYHAMTQAGGEHGAVALRQGLEEAHPGQVASGKIGIGTDGQRYDQLKISGGTGLSLPKDLAAKYNSRAPYEYQDSKVGSALQKYDQLNAGVKYAKLGGGLFHSFTTAGTTTGQQLSSLNLFKHPVDNLKVIAGTVSKTAHEANFGKFQQDGSLDFARQVGTTLGPKEILADANIDKLDTPIAKATNAAGALKNAAIKPIVALHDMVFQRQIPESKMLILRQSMKQQFPDIDFAHPTTEQINYGRGVAVGVNKLGGINHLISGTSYNTAKHLSRIVLAEDFTEAKLSTLYAALAKGGAEGKIARQMVVGKSLVFALPGMAAGVASGAINPKDPQSVADALGKQLLSPSVPLSSKGAPNKTNPDGTPQVAELPKTFISELGSIIAPALDKMNTNKLSGAENYASARLAALPSTVEQLATNKDFYGNPIHGTDKNGNPITPGQTAMNVASQVAPIPAVQGSKAATGAQNIKTAAMNTVGFRVTNDTNSPQGQHSKAVSDFYNTTKMLGVRQAIVRKQVQALVAAGNNNQAQRVIQQWNASLDPLTKPFREKYANHYNPAWDDADQGFMSYALKGSPASLQTRRANAVETSKILSNSY